MVRVVRNADLPSHLPLQVIQESREAWIGDVVSLAVGFVGHNVKFNKKLILRMTGDWVKNTIYD